MAANERSISLPSGGTVFVLDAIPHREATILRKHHLKIGRYMGAARDLDGKPTREFRSDLTPDQLDEKDDLITSTETVYIRTLTRRWSNVRSAEGDELTFPDDLDRMREDDLQFLAGKLLAGKDDPKAPNGSESPPESTLPPDASPTTSTSTSTSEPS